MIGWFVTSVLDNLKEGRGELRKALSMNPNDTDVVKALSVIGQ